jgi:hypothetical protein
VWHVKRAWLKNLQKKVAHFMPRQEMLAELSAVLELRDMEKAEQAVMAFLSKWVRAGWCSPWVLIAHTQEHPLPGRHNTTRKCTLINYS